MAARDTVVGPRGIKRLKLVRHKSADPELDNGKPLQPAAHTRVPFGVDLMATIEPNHRTGNLGTERGGDEDSFIDQY